MIDIAYFPGFHFKNSISPGFCEHRCAVTIRKLSEDIAACQLKLSREKTAYSKSYKMLEGDKPIVGECGSCGEPAELKCSGCKMVTYCKVECQKSAWKDHRQNCRFGYECMLFTCFCPNFIF